MAKTHRIDVRLNPERNVHVCIPPSTEVSPGDRVVWAGLGPESLLVFFPEESPVVEGRGPFKDNQGLTIQSKPPLKSGDKFVAQIAIRGDLRKTEGDIIVT